MQSDRAFTGGYPKFLNRANGEAAWLAVGESELARLPAKASSSVQKLLIPPCNCMALSSDGQWLATSDTA